MQGCSWRRRFQAKHVTLGGDKNYDTEEFVRELRRMHITPHVAQNHTNRTSAIDRRTTRHISYELSQQKRKRVRSEEHTSELQSLAYLVCRLLLEKKKKNKKKCIVCTE